jgi:hypothetical protein
LWQEKQEFLSQMPQDSVLHVRYDDLMVNPESAVRSMVAFLDLSPTDSQLAAAVSHVKQ